MDRYIEKFVSFKNLPYVIKKMMCKGCVEAYPVGNGWIFKILKEEEFENGKENEENFRPRFSEER